MLRAPELVTTSRLLLRKPRPEDSAEIFARYASDPEVARYLGWQRHRSEDDTRSFLAFSDAEWARWPAGPYLVCRPAGEVIGGTGLSFETEWRAATGYVLARDAWGQGYATEVLGAMVRLAPMLGVRRLYALCHVEHRASRRVLEKGGFEFEAVLRRHSVFPNLAGGPLDTACYARVF